MGKEKSIGFGLDIWLTCSFYLIVCSKLELDYICKSIAGNKSRPCMVNDSKYEGGPGRKKNRGLALGFNEFAGYLAVAIVGFVTGYLASLFGLKPYPFYIGIAFAVLGFLISWLVVRDTTKHTALEIKNHESSSNNSSSLADDGGNNSTSTISNLAFRQVFLQTSYKNRSLLAVSQAGLVNNLV